MKHVVLLGDSILDNAAYVGEGPDVRTQLEARLPAGWRVTLLAVDGSRTNEVSNQLEGLPGDASHLVVSAGGNDALEHVEFLMRGEMSIPDCLRGLAEMSERFDGRYREMLAEIRARGLPTAVCTIYHPHFGEGEFQRAAVTMLAQFNDHIIRQAFAGRLPLIDLRLVCSEDGDYANPIEPSAKGGEKIAAAIARLIEENDFQRPGTRVYC